MTGWSAAAPSTPFWRRLPPILALPLKRSVLTRIAVLSSLVLLWAAVPAPGFGGALAMAGIVLGAFAYGAQYGFAIIERTGQGFLDPDRYPRAGQGHGIARPIKYVAINGLFLLLTAGAAMLSAGSKVTVVFAWALLFGLLMPAVAVRLVMTGELRRSVSPSGLIDVTLRMGKPYLVLCAFVFGAEVCRGYGMVAAATAGGLGGALQGALAGHRASGGTGALVLLFLLTAAFWYSSYVICALIGHAMYQCADALDIAVIGPGETRALASRKVDVKARSRDALIGRMVLAGEIKEAIEVLSDDLRERPLDLALHARLHKLLLAENYLPRIDDHTDKYLDLLMKTGNEHEALALAEEAMARSLDWRPRTVEHIVPLARAALAAGRAPLATQLIKGFDKRFRGHPDVPQAYLVGAQVLLQAGGAGVAEARCILEHLLERHHADPVAEQARRTLARLDQLAR